MRFVWFGNSPTLVTLEDVLSAVATHTRIGGHARTAARTLQRLGNALNVVEEVVVLDHQVAGDDRQREVDLQLRLTSSQNHFLGAVPKLWSEAANTVTYCTLK